MNYKEIKLAFRQASGRYALIGPDGEDLGGGKFIRAGQAMLDQMLPRIWNSRVKTGTLDAGEYLLEFAEVRSIEKVWLITADGRYPLERVAESRILETFPDLSDLAVRGVPAYWAQTIRTEYSPSERTGGMVRGVLIVPPTDVDCRIEIEAVCYSSLGTEDDDISFWSNSYPMTLVHAACYQLEVFYRNTEGAKDWMAAITPVIEGLDNDEVRNTLSERMAMEG